VYMYLIQKIRIHIVVINTGIYSESNAPKWAQGRVTVDTTKYDKHHQSFLL
jgi:hypothetical protein